MKAIGHLRMRLLCLALCLICMMQMIPPVTAAPTEEAPEEIRYTSLVYYRADSASFVIGHFENGTALNVLGVAGSYYRVDCYDMTGYIPKSQVRLDAGTYYVNCQADSPHTDTISYVSLEDALSQRASLLQAAQAKLGCPYVYGCCGPSRFDCSGYTSYVYGQIGYQLMRGSQAQLEDGVIVSTDGLQVGDLLFFKGTHRRSYVTHVAIYAGNGQMLHADSAGVRFTSIDYPYYASRFVCARRVINVDATQAEQLATPSAQSLLTRARSTTSLR